MIDERFVPDRPALARLLADTLTPARLRALMVLAEGPARYGNVTSPQRRGRPSVYWQSANWMADNGLATIDHRLPLQVVLTDLGVWVLRRRLDGAPSNT